MSVTSQIYVICNGGRAGIDPDAQGFYCKLCGADLSKATMGNTHMRAFTSGERAMDAVDLYFLKIEELDQIWAAMTPEQQSQVDGDLTKRAMKRPGT